MECQDGSCNGKQCGNNSGNEQEKVDCPFDTCNIGYCYKGCVSEGCTKKRCPADGMLKAVRVTHRKENYDNKKRCK